MTFFPAEYWERRLAANFDSLGVGDVGMSRSYNEYLYRIRRQVFRRVARGLPLKPEACRVIDIGAGTGFYIGEWNAWGAREVAGLDITDVAVTKLRALYPESSFVRWDIGDADLPPGTERFDIASAFDVMFHITDDGRYARAIANIARLLRKQGWFIYSDNLVRHESRIAHYVSRTEEQILRSLDEAGFDVISRVPMFVLMNDPVRTSSANLRRWFSLVYRMAARGERWGRLVGAALYPWELMATKFVRSAPSTEVLVCRRR